MRKLDPLRDGDPIDVVAPASPFDRQRFERGIESLQAIGLRPRFDDGVFAKHGHLAGDDERRKNELRKALESDSKAVILARGGYGLLRFATQVTPRPKLVIGYSDATVLHELWRRHGLLSIHGPMCTQLGEDAAALERLDQLLKGKAPPELNWQPQTARAGRVEGALAGGNLATLASLCGTPLQPRFEGCIVVLEDLNEPPYRLDRLLTQLRESGALQNAKAFVIGDLTAAGEDPAGRSEAVAERLLACDVPLVFGAPFGHAGRNQPVLFGARHQLDAAAGTLAQVEQPIC